MSIDGNGLYAILAGDSGVDEKVATVTGFKAEVKRSFIQIDNVTRYFQALQLAVMSSDYGLHAVAFSCICHLVKRVITQDPNALQGEPADIVLPIIIEKFGDSKQSVRSTARRVFEDYWISCCAQTEEAMRTIGLVHENDNVKLECLSALTSRIQLQEGKFAFRLFTSPVISLLNDPSETVQQASEDLLTLFFKSAHPRAKQDLAKEMMKLGVAKPLASRILKQVGYSSTSSTSTPQKSAHTSSNQQSQGQNQGILSVSFVTDDKSYHVENLKPEYISSIDALQSSIEAMIPAFEGKESEHNWQQRERNVMRLRSLLNGNAPTEYPEETASILKYMSDGVCKAIGSLRTTLSSHGCFLIREAFLILGNHMDSNIEPYLTHLVKLTSSTKKIAHQTAAMTINAMILNSSFSVRYLNHVNTALNDKGASQAKTYGATWTRLLICKHYRHKSVMETNGLPMIEKILNRGLADANPGVREGMRSAFWAYHEVWPREARALMEKFDSATRKALERSNPGGAVSGSNKPLASASTNKPPVRATTLAKSKAPQHQQHHSASAPATTSQPQGLNAKPGRLGMPQRNNRAAAPTSSVKRSKPQATNSAPAAPLRSTSDSSDSSTKTVSNPTVLELITTDDPNKFDRGVNALSYLIAGLEVPDDLECYKPAAIPRPDIVSRVLQRLFVKRQNQYVKLFISPSILPKMVQFVGTGLLLSAIVDNGSNVEALRIVTSSLAKSEAFAELSSLPLSANTMEVLYEIVEGMECTGAVVGSCKLLKEVKEDGVQELLLKLCREHEQIEAKLHLLPKASDSESVPVPEPEPETKASTAESVSEKEEGGDKQEDSNTQEGAVDVDVDMTLYEEDPAPQPEQENTQEADESLQEQEPEQQQEPEQDPQVEQEQQQTQEESEKRTSPETVEPNNDGMDLSGDTNQEQEQEQEQEQKSEDEEMEDEADAIPTPEGERMELDDAQVESSDSDSKPSSFQTPLETPEEHTPAPEASEMEVDESSVQDTTITENDSAKTPMPAAREPHKPHEISGIETPRRPSEALSQASDVWQTPPKGMDEEEKENQNPEPQPQPQPEPAPEFKELDQEVEKLNIYEDKLKKDADPSTPVKKIVPNSPSWYHFESKKQVCLSPLPQREDEASRLFESLMQQLSNKTIDPHGFRKLITIVKGAKSGEDGVAFEIWRQEDRQLQLQKGLLVYLSQPAELTESQLNQGLLQLKQLLSISDAGSFDGSETAVFDILIKTAAVSSAKTIVYGALRETQDELISTVQHESCVNLLDGVINAYDGSQNRDQKVILLSTLSKLVGKINPVDALRTRVEPIGEIVLQSMSDKETYVRKEAYPVLVNLRQRLSPGVFSMISTQLSEGQQHLLEYYCKKSTN